MNKYIEKTLLPFTNCDKSMILTGPVEPDAEFFEPADTESVAALNLHDTLRLITKHDRDSLK